MRCAALLESKHATDAFRRVYWYVASDGVDVRRAAQQDYDQAAAGGRRRVLVLEGTGRHTSPETWASKATRAALNLGVEAASEARHAATAEALADWWLLGESDFSVIGSFGGGAESFARSAAVRTARNSSVVVAPQCSDRQQHARARRRQRRAQRLGHPVDQDLRVGGRTPCNWTCKIVPMWRGEVTDLV
mmetsp:Transcript_47315/g.148747  ORF Transcript_47315/g.148747 Transcript_47315/m.148747 type:complete len:190 (+) Transcript_47315:372-941(+)